MEDSPIKIDPHSELPTGAKPVGYYTRGMIITHKSGLSIHCPPECETRSQYRTRQVLLDGLLVALRGLEIDY